MFLLRRAGSRLGEFCREKMRKIVNCNSWAREESLRAKIKGAYWSCLARAREESPKAKIKGAHWSCLARAKLVSLRRGS